MSIISKIKKKLYFVAAGYFRFFAGFAFRRWHPRVIAITGSAGKTTMLNLVEFEFGSRAHYSHNANSAFGIAFDILGMDGIVYNTADFPAIFFPIIVHSYHSFPGHKDDDCKIDLFFL